MNLFTAISKRYSYRGHFKQQPISREDLRIVLEAGCAAPSGCNKQGTYFLAVDDKVILNNIANLLPMPAMKTASALIVCVADPTPAIDDMCFMLEDCAVAVENMWLALTAMGYATVWLDGILRRDSIAERIGEMLLIPEGLRVQVILPIGIPMDSIERPVKKPLSERAWFNKFGG